MEMFDDAVFEAFAMINDCIQEDEYDYQDFLNDVWVDTIPEEAC